MTTEEKQLQLLLTDLCARLPYDTIVSVDNGKYREDTKLRPYHLADFNTLGIRPHLRPMESITKEEKEQIRDLWIGADTKTYATRLIDFYNKHHLDYRGLIPMGLASPAPEGMYNN